MGTRARIGIEQPSGKIKSIYCHSDGYPGHTGATLLKHYDGDAKKVKALIAVGYTSFLYDTVEECAEKAANKGVKPKTVAGPDEFYMLADDCGGEFVYYMQRDGMWIGSVVGAEPNWLLLHDLIAKYPD